MTSIYLRLLMAPHSVFSLVDQDLLVLLAFCLVNLGKSSFLFHLVQLFALLFQFAFS
jgi:hypothetical protein